MWTAGQTRVIPVSPSKICLRRYNNKGSKEPLQITWDQQICCRTSKNLPLSAEMFLCTLKKMSKFEIPFSYKSIKPLFEDHPDWQLYFIFISRYKNSLTNLFSILIMDIYFVMPLPGNSTSLCNFAMLWGHYRWNG